MNPTREEGRRLKPFEKKIIGIVIAVIVVIAGFSIFYGLESRKPSGNVLVVYTYGSFMEYGSNPNQTYAKIFGTFEKEYGVTIEVEKPQAGILQTLEAQKSDPQANIAIGLTNMNGIQAVKDGLLVKYTPGADSYINSTLLKEMGYASQYITPYEYSYLGIDYNRTGTGSGVFQPTFQDLLSSSNLSNLIVENPTTSNTGAGFLLWEIAYYEFILHENWTKWWNSSLPVLNKNQNIYTDWSSAFSHFESASNKSLLVSYLTDPAYNNYFGYGNDTGSTVTVHNGTNYGWRTIYGIGIVNGSGNLSLEEKFVNYFLGGLVQNEIPDNEWMYPANSTISMPPYYNVTMNQNSIVPLNDYINATAIYDNFETWETEWLAIG
ncbi:MAG: thiamine ABC transporter substrate-binding protein [Thermoplasmata archaeon]